MSARKIQKRPKKGGEVDRVYGLLKGWILNCRFRPGDFLPEVEVAEQCETSRTPIREACNRLEEEKWLSKIQNKGYMVRPISVQEIVEVYQYRKLLECFAAERAAQIITAEDVALLKNIAAAEKGPHPNIHEIIKANFALHSGIGRLTQNERVYDQLILTLEYVHRLDILSTQREVEWVPHDDILIALETHNVKGAHKAMADHIDDSRDRMLRVFFRGEMPSFQRLS